MTTHCKRDANEALEEIKYALGEVIFLELEEVEGVKYDEKPNQITVIKTNGESFLITIEMRSLCNYGLAVAIN